MLLLEQETEKTQAEKTSTSIDELSPAAKGKQVGIG